MVEVRYRVTEVVPITQSKIGEDLDQIPNNARYGTKLILQSCGFHYGSGTELPANRQNHPLEPNRSCP